MGGNAIIDPGAILALLDRSDRWHQRCTDAFRQLRLPVWTSEAVLTELFHLVGDNVREVRAAWKFVRSGALTVASMSDDELPLLDALMHQYRDRPMDFADALNYNGCAHSAPKRCRAADFTIQTMRSLNDGVQRRATVAGLLPDAPGGH